MTVLRRLGPLARLASVCLVVCVLVSTAAVVLPVPDLDAAWRFLSGGVTGQAGAIAVIITTIWSLLLAGSALALGAAGRACWSRIHLRARRWIVPVGLLLFGLLLLGGGAVRHWASPSALCCGSVREAGNLAR